MRQSQQIKGEYTRVSQWTAHPEELEKAYFTPITEQEAECLIHSYFPNADIVFYPEVRASANEMQGNFFIRLPNNLLSPEDIENKINYPRLQLGVVLHELAHIKAGLGFGHSMRFVEALDSLVKENLDLQFKERISKFVEEQAKKKKIAKSIGKILQSLCPTCQKPAKIQSSIEDLNNFYHQLECGHLISVPKVRRLGPVDDFQSVKGEKLYNFQKENVEKFREANGRLCIFDEMGLGKTPSSIAISHVYNLFPVLVICKSGLRHQWAKMLDYWGNKLDDDIGLPQFSNQVIENSKDACLPGRHFYIVSYDLLPSLSSDFFQKVSDGKHSKPLNLRLCIIDECQHIKNPESQRTRAVFEVCRAIPNIIFTSGTPIKNNAVEFYPTLHMIDPIRFPNKARFASEFVDTYMKGPYIKYGGIRDFAKFKEVTEKFIIRHTQAEVLPDLPDITRNFRYVDLEGKAESEYADVAKEFTDYYYNESKEDRQFFQNVLQFFTKMRHITGLAKVDEAFDFATEFLSSTDRKLAIFTHHIDVRELLVEKLNVWLKENELPNCLELVGSMDGNAKEQLKEKFNFNPRYRLLVASTLASGEGHNLQHACSDCVMLERQWNPANEEQAEFRFKRPGQKSSVINATYLVALETIDEYFTQLVENKRIDVKYSLDGTAKNWNENEILKDLAEMIAKNSNRKILKGGRK